jgi:transitional endoplasmic reticulum ATPase
MPFDHNDGKAGVLSAKSMLNDSDGYFERRILTYINNLLEAVEPSSMMARRICAAAEGYLHLPEQNVKFPANEGSGGKKYYELKGGMINPVVVADWKVLTNYFKNLLNETPPGEPDELHGNLMRLADSLGLDETGRDVLCFIHVCQRQHHYRDFLGSVFDSGVAKLPPGVACMLGRPQELQKIARLLGASGQLMSNGLTYYEERDRGVIPMIDGKLWENLSLRDLDENELVGSIVGEPVSSPLTLEDFSYLGEDLNHLVDLVRNAVKNGERGINILIYGPQGTGKTELARTVAQALGLSMYEVGQDKKDQGEEKKSNVKRLGELLRAQALLKGNDKAVIGFHEIEDLLIKGTDTDKAADTESKVGINTLLETNPVVTLWTGNNPEKFHASMRSRFTFSVHVGAQPPFVRQRIWKKQIEMQKLDLPAADVLTLARKYDAPPRMIENAVRNARIAGGTRDKIEMVLDANARITLGHTDAVLVKNPVPEHFRLSQINAGPDTEQKIEELMDRGRERKPVSLFVKEKPGAGAGAMLRYMGENMNMNVLEVSMRDIAQPNPMIPPEDRLRGLFQAAADDRKFLVIHGIENLAPGDGLSAWRNNALAQTFCETAKTHRLPFAVTTTKENIPDAVTSLFSESLSLQFLTANQVRDAWPLYFGDIAIPETAGTSELSLADFEEVCRGLRGRKEKTFTGDEVVEALTRQHILSGPSGARGFGS